MKSASSCGLAADASLLAPEGWSGKDLIALDLNIHDAPAALICDSVRRSELILGFWFKERYTLAHCEQQEKLVERYMSTLQDWLYVAYPQNEALRGISERQSREHAQKAKDRMKEIRKLMQRHRSDCDVCKDVVVLQSASLGVE